MKFKNMPLIVMLFAGLITSIISVVKRIDTTDALTTLFIVLLSFYVLGMVCRGVINKICFPKEVNIEENDSEESEGSEEDGQKTPQEESSN